MLEILFFLSPDIRSVCKQVSGIWLKGILFGLSPCVFIPIFFCFLFASSFFFLYFFIQIFQLNKTKSTIHEIPPYAFRICLVFFSLFLSLAFHACDLCQVVVFFFMFERRKVFGCLILWFSSKNFNTFSLRGCRR